MGQRWGRISSVTLEVFPILDQPDTYFAGSGYHSTQMELLERSESLDKLTSAFEQTLRGRGQTVFISGEAGIGKTALVRSFLRANKDRYMLLEGYCDSLFAARPLGPLFDIAPRLESPLGEILKSNAGRDQIFPAVIEAIEMQTRPVILFFEDIQWADEATLDFIRFLARRIAQLQCLFVLTLRDTEITLAHPYRKFLGELPPTDYLKLQLQPLSRDTVRDMAENAGRDGEEIFRLTAGIPYYVSEVLASYHNKIPETIRDSILSLYHRQFDQTRDLWEKLSIIPGRVELEILKHIHTSSSKVVEFCYRAGIILDDGYAVSFKHELFRKTIEESLSPHRQRELHQIVVEAMLQVSGMDVPYARIVHHARLAGDIKRLQEFAPKAAQEASMLGAHGEAAKFYKLGLEVSADLSSTNLADLYEKYSHECYLTSQIPEAIRALESTLALLQENDQLRKGNTYRLLSRLYWYQGELQRAEQLGALAIKFCEPYPDSHELAMAYGNQAYLKLENDLKEECLQLVQLAMEIANRINDQEVQCHALNTHGMAFMKDEATLRNGEEMIRQSLRIALDLKLDEHAARAFANMAFVFLELGWYAKAADVIKTGLQYCHERDLPSWTNYLQSSKVKLLLHTGNWNEAIVLCEQMLQKLNQQYIVRIAVELVYNTMQMRRGQLWRDSFPDMIDQVLQVDCLQHLAPVTALVLESEWLNGNRDESGIVHRCIEKISASDLWWYYSEINFWLDITQRMDLKQVIEQSTQHDREEDPYLAAIKLAQGDDDEQREALSKLLDMGADASAARVEGKMRDKGITQIPRGPRSSTRENAAGLTKRQMEVLALLATGMQNKEIADQLFLSAKTIDHHISDILAKLDVSSRSKAVAKAMELGLI